MKFNFNLKTSRIDFYVLRIDCVIIRFMIFDDGVFFLEGLRSEASFLHRENSNDTSLNVLNVKTIITFIVNIT